ncbi:hypothetical protein [Bowmanella denitrificans]|uniref:hypothetical protein n=1 Tax=Bowmanella denitrificans TaxID=366582 RepID=UPI0011AEC452|nr:hypothetical protein [Bowmanella denitrificans]
MDTVLIISIYVILILISSLPCLLLYLIAAKLLPSRYSVKPKTMTFSSIVLSIITALALKVELEGGVLSVPFVIIVLSVAWSLVLLIFLVLYKESINATYEQ